MFQKVHDVATISKVVLPFRVMFLENFPGGLVYYTPYCTLPHKYPRADVTNIHEGKCPLQVPIAIVIVKLSFPLPDNTI